MTPEEFATALFEKWGIGKSDKDNGLLLLISRDDRAVQIRTGYGLEGVVPDIIAGRVIRDEIVPRFRNGDYDGGTLAAVKRLSAVILDPSVREELMSAQKNDTPKSISDGFDGEEVFSFFLKGALAIALIMLAIIIYYIRSSRRMDDVERWRYLNTLWVPAPLSAAEPYRLPYSPGRCTACAVTDAHASTAGLVWNLSMRYTTMIISPRLRTLKRN